MLRMLPHMYIIMLLKHSATVQIVIESLGRSLVPCQYTFFKYKQHSCN